MAPKGVARLYCADRSLAAIARREAALYVNEMLIAIVEGPDAPWRGEAVPDRYGLVLEREREFWTSGAGTQRSSAGPLPRAGAASASRPGVLLRPGSPQAAALRGVPYVVVMRGTS